MDRSEMCFCPDLVTGLTTQVISNELAEKVFGYSGFAKLLKARYDQMSQLFRNAHYDDQLWNLDEPFSDCKNKPDPTKRDARLVVPRSRLVNAPQNVTRLFDYDNFGHDMPVWLSYTPPHKNTKCVMIISQDPKRDNDVHENIYLSTPFGLHSKDWRQGNAQVKRIAHILMENGYCVYLTDSMKFYAGDGNVVRQSIKENDRDGYKNTFSCVLNAEIKKVDPKVIIKLGDDALVSDYVDSVYASSHNAFDGFDLQEIDGRRVIAAYHPNGTRGAIERIKELVNNADRPVVTYYESIAQTARNYLETIV